MSSIPKSPLKSSDKFLTPPEQKQEITVSKNGKQATVTITGQQTETNRENTETTDNKIKVASPVPFYVTGGTVFVLALLIRPWKWWQYLVIAVIGALTFLITKLFSKPKTFDKPVEHELVLTGFAETDTMLKHADSQLRQIKKSAETIEKTDTAFAGTLRELTDDAYKLVDYISEHEKQISQLRRFFNYYLPTLEKFAGEYVNLEKGGSQAEHVTRTKEEITDATDAMKVLFKKLFDKMYTDTALDISTDVDVLETMLKSDGVDVSEDIIPEQITEEQ